MTQNLTINWISDSFHSRAWQRDQIQGRPSPLQGLMSQSLPFTLDYFSDWNPLFLSKGLSLEFLNQKSIWTLRDGVLPILAALETLDSKKLSTTFLVEDEVSAFLPEEWLSKSRSYRILSRPRAKSSPTAILWTGGIGVEQVSIEELKSEWKQIENHWSSRRAAHLPIYAFFPNAKSDFLRRLEEICGKSPRFLTLRQIEDFHNMQGVIYHETNSKLICADSYLLHLALSRGAQATSIRTEKIKKPFLDLSLYHSLQILPNSRGRDYL